MSLEHLGYVDLPPHRGPGGFDHAAVHRGRHSLYVAHTGNDAIDVIDLRTSSYLRSIDGLKGVAGALVHEKQNLVFTSNRGEDSVGIFAADRDDGVAKVEVGVRPNGLAYDPDRGVLLCANVGDPDVAGSYTASLVDVRARALIASVAMPGRTRWTVFDPDQKTFFVNIADPAQVVVVDAHAPHVVARRIQVPNRGPHGLDLDRSRRRLYCACDGGKLVALDSRTGEVIGTLDLSGAPDVIFLNERLARLYVAIGDPGVVDVIDVVAWKRIEVVATELGAHTIALEEGANRVYAFLPRTHRASVFQDRN